MSVSVRNCQFPPGQQNQQYSTKIVHRPSSIVNGNALSQLKTKNSKLKTLWPLLQKHRFQAKNAIFTQKSHVI
jgi:hypothetical protein